MRSISTLAPWTLAGILGLIQMGCASYATPGRGADLRAVGVTPEMQKSQSDPGIQRAMETKPLASFPSSIAVVRIQSPGYRSQTAEGWGRGQYSIVTTRDIEKNEDFARLEKLPQVRGIAPVNRLLLSEDLHSDMELRQAAARLHADMLLIYTLDTTFKNEDKMLPLSVVTLGLSPNQQVRLTSTASAILMDTRSGFIYGLAEATDQKNQLTSAWTSANAADEARRDAETAAFGKLVAQMETTWGKVVNEYGSSAKQAAQCH